MCGVAGIINWEEDLTHKSHVFLNMLKTLTARGSDSQGIYIEKQAALGHTRLIVTDAAGGAQPMIRYQSGEKSVITFNGNIYNRAELCAELKSRGYEFSTISDAETVLAAYIEWGADFVKHMNGVFAFAIWNDTKKTLFMARDRLGAKPLFYAKRGANLIFGSELKTLLAHPDVKPKINSEGLAEIFMMGPARTPGHGIFCDVHELKPGHILYADKHKMTISQYWAFAADVHQDDFETTAKTVREIFEDSVRRQLVSDMPVCCLLSGGLDSTIITGLAAEFYRENGLGQLNTYSVNYVDHEKFFTANNFQANSDEPWARLAAKHFRTNHHTVLIDTPELADKLPDAALARDLPGMADIDSSLYIFSREIKKEATVALSGECADEIFGGYPWFHRPEMLAANTFPWSMSASLRLDWLSEDVMRKIRPLEYVAERYHDTLNEVPRLPGEDKDAARIREISYLSQTRFMPTLLDRKDRMSMANRLEARIPFGDHRLVDYVFNIPWGMKCYKQREKGLLRHAFKNILPDDVLWRKKNPYPKTHNPGYTNTVVKKALAIFDEGTSPLLPLINVKNLRQIAESDLSAANIPWFGQLMGGAQLFAYLVQMDVWLREYKVEVV
jgi:asparagine synthase (glutamine-hydrolysing)